MDQTKPTYHNFNTISPSAKSLLLMKGNTNIPFARQTAELLQYPEKYTPDFDQKNFDFWTNILHFEERYWSIDQLLADLSIRNILELSSGFSFRGLETTKQKGFYYIDTDLPDVVATKKELITALREEGLTTESNFELLPLNALDEKQFHDTVSHFPKGEIAIVNEGLLMYLDINEKEKLCNIIHNILSERGGCWITADIYVKSTIGNRHLNKDQKRKEFFDQHRIEDNKFESFKAAEEFFNRLGYQIDKEATVQRSSLSSMKYFLQNGTEKQIGKIRKAGKIRNTWRLRIEPE